MTRAQQRTVLGLHFLVAAAFLASCESPRTEIVLRIDTDMTQGPGQGLTGIRVRVFGEGQVIPQLDRRYDLGVGDQGLLPSYLGIGAKEPGRLVRVEVDALHGELLLFTRTAAARFVEERTLELDVFLARRCREAANASCMSGSTCGASGCEPELVEMPTTFLGPHEGDGGVGGDGSTPRIVSIAAGGRHACALRSTGDVWCWGDNAQGQLGDGTNTPKLSPVRVSDLDDATAITAGDSFTCALLTDRTVKCWGANMHGQLGNGATEPEPPAALLPVAVVDLAGVTSIDAGDEHACAVLASGEAHCWGLDDAGQLGDGTTGGFRATPAAVSNVANFVSVAAGYRHTCGVLTSLQAACWGSNEDGRLGTGNITDQAAPTTVSGLSNAADIATPLGGAHSCARDESGQVWCWGWNGDGEVGVPGTDHREAPGAVSGMSDAVAIAVGNSQSCAIRVNGEVACWGAITHVATAGGEGTPMPSATPVAVPSLEPSDQSSVGNLYVCSLSVAGAVACWGDNASGQLGDGTTTEHFVPAPVGFSFQ